MLKVQNTNAPSLSGWMIALMMGIIAAAAAIMVGEFRYVIGGFFGALVFVGAGLVMGMPWGATVATPVAKPVVLPETVAAAVPPAMAAPVAAPLMAPVAAPVTASTGPEQLAAPRGGVADDLKEIEGIGPALEKLCNELGFYHFDQIASWSEADITWVDANMKTFKGRIARDKWVAQAKLIESEGLDAFRIRAKANDY